MGQELTRVSDGLGPLLDIQVFNKSRESHCPPRWNVIELTQTGNRANVNEGLDDADEIYFAYNTTDSSNLISPRVRKESDSVKAPSPFGYVPNGKGEMNRTFRANN